MGYVVGRRGGRSLVEDVGADVGYGILELWRWTLEHCIVRIIRRGVLCANVGCYYYGLTSSYDI